MGATSVTGKGLGESHGLHKPENGGGCCPKATPTETPVVPVKQGCYTLVKTGGITKYRVGNSSSKNKVC